MFIFFQLVSLLTYCLYVCIHVHALLIHVHVSSSTCAMPPTHLQLMHQLISTLCPLSLPHEIVQVVSHSYTEYFLATGGSYECNTYCVAALGWLKKEF